MRSFLLVSPLAICLISCRGGGENGGGTSTGNQAGPSTAVHLAPRAILGGEIVTATITFSADVTGFSVGDITVSGGSAGALTSTNGHTYLFSITAAGTGASTVDVEVPAGVCVDGSGHGNLAANDHAAIACAPWGTTGTDSYGAYADLVVSGNGLTAIQRFRLMPPGTFIMGCPAGEPGSANAGQRPVTLTTPCWMADTACTQRLWKVITNANPSFSTADGLDAPVDSVSFIDVQGFLGNLATAVPGLSPRLPTEAEWEYAARAGSTTPFGVSPVTTDGINCLPDITDPYITAGTWRGRSVAVKSLSANAWGIFEANGNIRNWCSDAWQSNWDSTPVTDPIGPISYGLQVARGGYWGSSAQNCRCDSRMGADTLDSFLEIGFRIVAPSQPSGSG